MITGEVSKIVDGDSVELSGIRATIPEPGVVIAGCEITRILDGDTAEVEIRRRVRIRFRDCWAPETKETSHSSEKKLGLIAKEVLEGMAPVGTVVTLDIQTDGDGDIGDGITFGRVVADLYTGAGVNLSEAMIDSGHCFRTKSELEAYLRRQDGAKLVYGDEEGLFDGL